MGSDTDANGEEKVNWDERRAELEDAFRGLSENNETTSENPYEQVIPNIARELMLISPIMPKAPGEVTEHRAKRELSNIAKTLNEALGSLSETSLAALNFRREALLSLMTTLGILSHSASKANIPQISGNSGLGQPKKVQPRQIALVVARHYNGLTGKAPTVPSKDGKAYGPFMGLLKKVYEIIGVDASAEAQAKNAVKDWKSKEVSQQKKAV